MCLFGFHTRRCFEVGHGQVVLGSCNFSYHHHRGFKLLYMDIHESEAVFLGKIIKKSLNLLKE